MSLKTDIDGIRADVRELRDLVTLVRLDIAGLKVKSGIWGAIAGMTTATLLVLGWILAV